MHLGMFHLVSATLRNPLSHLSDQMTLRQNCSVGVPGTELCGWQTSVFGTATVMWCLPHPGLTRTLNSGNGALIPGLSDFVCPDAGTKALMMAGSGTEGRPSSSCQSLHPLLCAVPEQQVLSGHLEILWKTVAAFSQSVLSQDAATLPLSQERESVATTKLREQNLTKHHFLSFSSYVVITKKITE